MKLSQLIERLQADLVRVGDVQCYTNGEHGSENSIRISHLDISSNKAILLLDNDRLENEIIDQRLAAKDEIVCHIGGY